MFSRSDLSAAIVEEGQAPVYLFSMGMSDREIFPFDAEEDISEAVASLVDYESGEALAYVPDVATLNPGDQVAMVDFAGESAGWVRGRVYLLRVQFTDIAGVRVWTRTLGIIPIV